MQIKYIGKNGDNSYIISGEKTAVVECMKHENAAYHIKAVEAALDGGEPDYIILDHVSPDNAGSAEALMQRYGGARIIASAAGIKNLSEMLNRDFDYILAKDDMTLELGGASLIFKILPNLPWTDSMVAYCPEERALFCGSIFNSDSGYFKNVISPYRDYAKNAADRLRELDILKIFPAYGGEITDISGVLDEYSEPEERKLSAAVFYASHYGYTREMAEAVAAEIEGCGMSTRLFDVCGTDLAELKDAIDSCTGFAVGTDTVNRNAPEDIWRLITAIDMVNGRGKPCMIFGSCGWSGEGVYLIERFLKSIGMKLFKKPLLVKFRMSGDEREKLEKLAADFAKELSGSEGE